jgi:hypothetical protein
MEGSSQYQRLWQFMYNYFTKTKGLNNLIWLNPQCGTVSSAYFPGSAWCDFTGGDTYGTGLHADIFNGCKAFAGSMPIALHECGYIPDPGQLQSQGINFVLFSNWNNQWLTNQGTSYINTVYSHSFVITRDELPNLKSGSTVTSPPSETAAPTAVPGQTAAPTATPASGGSCGTCNWYGTNYPLCCTTTSGWGWENSQSCVSQSTCNSQSGGTVTAAPTTLPSGTAAPTATPASGGGSNGCTCVAGCSSQTTVSSSFTKDGVGEFCFVASSLGSYINSWNLDSLVVNGTSYTNKYANVSSLPKNSDGKYYIYYKGSYSWCHFEAK